MEEHYELQQKGYLLPDPVSCCHLEWKFLHLTAYGFH